MEEIEITSWLTLDALKGKAKIVDTVGNLQSGHTQSVFCVIEDDYLELGYIDTAASYLRRYEDKDEFELALEAQKEEEGEAPYDENRRIDDNFIEKESGGDITSDESSEDF
jgi:hypothetical protein